MSSQTASSRRQAAIAAAAKLGPMRDDVAEAIERQRAIYAEKRAARAAMTTTGERRRTPERRLAEASASRIDDRRVEDRRQFATMQDKLRAEAERQEQRGSTRFTGSPSAWMDSLKGDEQ